MNKILTFIVNENNELLLLKGNSNDPQFKKSLWYVVTGACEQEDNSYNDTVKREIKEETGLSVQKIIYLNWIFTYTSLGNECTEYAHISFIKGTNVKLNEENIDYKWYNLDDFIANIHWYSDKNVLKSVLIKALNRNLFFKEEKVEELKNI